MNSRTITQIINVPANSVYQYVSDPRNLPEWAPGFARAVKYIDGSWTVEMVDGVAKLAFVDQNDLGVLDHWVTMPDRCQILNPMRVIPNGSDSEIIFTLFQRPEMSDRQFNSDAVLVSADLKRLKVVLEAPEHQLQFREPDS